MWAKVPLYGAPATGEGADLVRRARAASAEVEALEASLATALEERNSLLLEIAAAGLSARQISEAVGGRLGTSGVRYGILKARETR